MTKAAWNYSIFLSIDAYTKYNISSYEDVVVCYRRSFLNCLFVY